MFENGPSGGSLLRQLPLNFIKRLSLPVTLLVVLALLVQLAGPELGNLLRYERDGVARWQVWRLLTGHLVHLSWLHLALNIGGLLLLVLGFGDHFVRATGRVPAKMVLLALGVGAGLWWGSPGVGWYAGLSGVLHGLAVLLAVDMWRQEKIASVLLLGGLVVKVSWEQVTGGELEVAEAVGGTHVVDANLYGVVSGIGLVLLSRGWRWARTRFNGARKPE